MINLQPNLTRGASLVPQPGGWRLEIPAGPAGRYRLAQLDDYHGLPRRVFPWREPLFLSLTGRASSGIVPGTWGFGLWNDPFSLSLGLGGGVRRFPALPNAAWFFFASAPNYLSLRDDLPARGSLAAVFASPHMPAWLLAAGAPAAALLAFRPLARLVRRFARRIVRQEADELRLDPCDWHTYDLDWEAERVRFRVDGQVVMTASISPGGPLGLVIWVDNQYAAFPPDGRLKYGTLPNPEPVWIEVKDLVVNSTAPVA